VHKGVAPKPDSPCFETTECVYTRLFTLINDAARAAKEVADVLIVSAFADVDALYDKVNRTGDVADLVDAWTAQVYRGISFGDFFSGMGNSTSKPVLLTEYGVDAYHDACGTNKEDPCYNTYGDDSKSYEDGYAQAAYAGNLTSEIYYYGSDHKHCDIATKGWDRCSAIGGFLMSWVDEYWKGAKSQAACSPTYDDPDFSPKGCTEKAHVTCGNWDAAAHDICGYWLDAAPDKYVNEQWFGINSPTRCADSIDSLRPRHIFWQMREMWSGRAEDDETHALFGDCEELVTERCVALGNGGRATFLDWLVTPTPLADSDGRLACSGHGSCTTDWQACGPGDANTTTTPCCSCDFGFAGDGCEQLDARLYVVLGASCTLGLLMLLMLLVAGGKLLCGRRKVGLDGGAQPLLSFT